MRLWSGVLLLVCVLFLVHCKVCSNGEAPNQGAVQQTAAGQIVANLSSRGIQNDSRLTEQSMIALYLYKKKDYSLSCVSAADRQKCEDGLIFKNEKVDSLGFTNEPGYFGYDADFQSYFPMLVADPGHNYPSSKPSDPAGFADPDVWQCMRIPFSTDPNYGKYECGVNSHPIRYFNKQLTTYTLQVYATNGKGYASSYILDYNLFNSLNHPVKDGDRYYAYFAVHYNATKAAADSEDRFDANATTWKRPIEPDLVSPRIEIKVKLLPEGPYDKAGSVYDIPDYSRWYDPLAGCRATQSVPANSIYISEILWMGSEDTSGTSATEDEFIEIYNSNAFDVSISGWKLNGVGSGTGAIVLPTCATIKANSVYTVGKQTTKAITKLDYVVSDISLSNSGEGTLNIQDSSGTIVSQITGCTTGPWGGFGVNGGSGLPKRSMRLTSIAAFAGTCAAGWSTTSTADTSYSTSSGNLNSSNKAGSDAVEGTVATPGYAGP
ncbi:MAG: lamin tail domain-containing protein [Turneriella sp.]